MHSRHYFSLTFITVFISFGLAEEQNKAQIHGVVISEQLQTPDKTFKWLDTNEDDGITFDEYLMKDLNYIEMVKKEFKKIDKDDDGKISQDEYDEFFDATLKEILEKQMEYTKLTLKYIDRNNDEKLDVDEFSGYIRSLARDPTYAPEVFKQFDNDKDGKLDIEEFRIVQFQFPFDKFPLFAEQKLESVKNETQV